MPPYIDYKNDQNTLERPPVVPLAPPVTCAIAHDRFP